MSAQQLNASHFRRAALHYNDTFGWNVIPCIDKVPRLCRWEPWKSTVQTPRDIKAMPWDRANGLGVISGEVSDWLGIRDFDTDEAYHRWAAQHPQLARRLPTVKTARGYHLYFRVPRQFSRFAKYEDGEYRAAGGQFTVCPPSLHPTGVCYAWLIEPGGQIPLIGDPIDAGFMAGEPAHRTSRACTGPVPASIPSTHSTLLSATRAHEDGGVALSSGLESKGGRNAKARPAREGTIRYGDTWLRILLHDVLPRKAALHQPTSPKTRNGCLLRYVRSILRKHDRWTPNLVKAAAEVWVLLIDDNPHVATKDFASNYRDLVNAFKRVHTPQDRMDHALVVKAAQRETLPRAAKGYPESVRLLLQCCIHLAGLGGGTFYLSGEDAGKLTGLTEQWGRKYRARLVEDGFLELVKKGSNLTGAANTYKLTDRR